MIVTGGAGFLGCNLCERLASERQDVLVVDSLARAGVENNLAWLRQRHPQRVTAEIADIRDPYVINHLVHDASAIVHLAAQVAVTTCLADPMTDFEVNALGTIHLLEALRKGCATSDPVRQHEQGLRRLGDVAVTEHGDRYLPLDPGLRSRGWAKRQPLDLQTPLRVLQGCRGPVRARLRRCTECRHGARQSCVYGPHQLGPEEQGWVAWFVLAGLRGLPLTIYGDGKQVRDILYVDDAVAGLFGRSIVCRSTPVAPSTSAAGRATR